MPEFISGGAFSSPQAFPPCFPRLPRVALVPPLSFSFSFFLFFCGILSFLFLFVFLCLATSDCPCCPPSLLSSSPWALRLLWGSLPLHTLMKLLSGVLVREGSFSSWFSLFERSGDALVEKIFQLVADPWESVWVSVLPCPVLGSVSLALQELPWEELLAPYCCGLWRKARPRSADWRGGVGLLGGVTSSQATFP